MTPRPPTPPASALAARAVPHNRPKLIKPHAPRSPGRRTAAEKATLDRCASTSCAPLSPPRIRARAHATCYRYQSLNSSHRVLRLSQHRVSIWPPQKWQQHSRPAGCRASLTAASLHCLVVSRMLAAGCRRHQRCCPSRSSQKWPSRTAASRVLKWAQNLCRTRHLTNRIASSARNKSPTCTGTLCSLQAGAFKRATGQRSQWHTTGLLALRTIID